MRLAGRSIKTEQASARWWSPARGVFCTQVSGHFTMDVVDLFVGAIDEVIGDTEGQLRSFHDLRDVVSYDSRARLAYTEQSKPIMHRVQAVEMLFSSGLIAMGISVANIVLGGKLKGTSDVAAFERRRDAAIASANPR